MSDAPIDFSGALERHRRQCADVAAKWREWATTQPQTTFCIRHATELALDEENSIRATFAGKDFVARYAACAGCAEDARTRARSGKLRDAGVTDENVLHATFDNFVCRSDVDRENLEVVREFSHRLRGFVILLGPVGTGKTHLSVAAMRAADCRSRFTTHSRLLRRLRETYRDKGAEDPVAAFSSVRLMVLDEVGLSAGGRDELPMLHDILSARHEGRKPTIITSNLGEAEFRASVGERMADRLRQSGVAMLAFAGTSMRAEFRAEYHKDSP